MDVDFFRAANDVFLEVEVPSKRSRSFEQRYEAITGVAPTIGNGYQIQENKWGLEVRVYFNCEEDLEDEFTSVDVHVERGGRPYKANRIYRVNDREFFWALVNNGYRLGEN